METQSSPSEDLPALYRAILDGVAQLERIGERREAALLRADATRLYSASWDQGNLRRLDQIRRRIERIIAGDERPRTAPPRSHSRRELRRSVPVR